MDRQLNNDKFFADDTLCRRYINEVDMVGVDLRAEIFAEIERVDIFEFFEPRLYQRVKTWFRPVGCMCWKRDDEPFDELCFGNGEEDWSVNVTAICPKLLNAHFLFPLERDCYLYHYKPQLLKDDRKIGSS